MSASTEQPQDQIKTDTTAENLSKQRQMYERRLDQERQARAQLEERLAAAERASQERAKQSPLNEDEDHDDEPYVDKRKLNKTLQKFGEQNRQQTQQEIQQAVAQALDQERQTNYLKDNSDFKNVMTEETIAKFADKHPRLAENILRMPDGFERQKLVYENIKALGIDKPEQKQSSVQERVDANRRGPSYQPSGTATAPYASGPAGKDYSDSEMKTAYSKMQELKKRLKI